MLNSLYLSLWVTNFISVVNTETRNPYIWQLLMLVTGNFQPPYLMWCFCCILIYRICPFVFVLPVIGEIVKTASALSAIAELELDVMGGCFCASVFAVRCYEIYRRDIMLQILLT